MRKWFLLTVDLRVFYMQSNLPEAQKMFGLALEDL